MNHLAGKKKEYSFEDMASDSAGKPQRPDYIQAVRSDRTSVGENGQLVTLHPRRRDEEEEARPQKKTRLRWGRAVPVIFLMLLLTVAAALFLVFKVQNIEVTGEGIPGVSVEEIIAAADVEQEENLVFLDTGERERRLEEQIPYIAKAKLKRHLLRKTLEIQLTAAKPAASVLAPGQGWAIVSSSGKVLEIGQAPAAGALQVTGFSPQDPAAGQPLAAGEEQEQSLSALMEILTALQNTAHQTQGQFSVLDLSDLSHILLYYESRIEFRLGNVLDLGYKVEAGCRFLAELGPEEIGIMDLSETGDTRKAIFTNGVVTVPVLGQSTPSGQETAIESSQPESSQGPRAGDIPAGIYTGESSASAAEDTPEEPADDGEDWSDDEYPDDDYSQDYSEDYDDEDSWEWSDEDSWEG